MSNEDWKQELQALIEQARQENKWLWCHYQSLWFSPDELEKQNRDGKFLWGVVNWQLRDPNERLAEFDSKSEQMKKEKELFEKRMKGIAG